jgi:PAS domain-containing protein
VTEDEVHARGEADRLQSEPNNPPQETSTTQPLELILARNLVSIISLGALLFDADGAIVFYNDAAGEIVGSRFEETGPIPMARWSAELGPFDEQGRHLPRDNLPLTIALRDGRPGYGRFHIRTESELVAIEATALPLVGLAGQHGALVVFWPLNPDWPG